MFVKSSWSTYKGKRYQQFHLAESYRDPETTMPRHRLLMNLTPLPPHVIEAVRQSLKTGRSVERTPRIKVGDVLRGAGVLALYCFWDRTGMDALLGELTPPQRNFIHAMVGRQILQPGGAPGLEEYFRDTVCGRFWPGSSLGKDEEFHLMNKMSKQFYTLQNRLLQRHAQSAPLVLWLYDLTGRCLNGRKAEDGKYRHVCDERGGFEQAVVGLVCDRAGIPLAVEIWPGNNQSLGAMQDRVNVLRQRLEIARAVLVGNQGVNSGANIKVMEAAGLEYILGPERRPERRRLEPCGQRDIVEWEENGVRYLSCPESWPDQGTYPREASPQRFAPTLADPGGSAPSQNGCIRLNQEWRQSVADAGLADLRRVNATPLGLLTGPEETRRLQPGFASEKETVQHCGDHAGKYVLRTSLPAEEYPASQVDQMYHLLRTIERVQRYIMGYLTTLPVCYHHYQKDLVYGHVLIFFLAYYLLKVMELEMRKHGENREAKLVLRDWDRLHLIELNLEVEGQVHVEWHWSLGMDGRKIRDKLKQMGWWSAIEKAAHNLDKSI